MKKILMTSIILSNAACLASDTELYQQRDEKKEHMLLEQYKKLGMESNLLTGEFNFTIKKSTTSMPHHIQRFLQNSDSYIIRDFGTVFSLLKLYDGSETNNIKKIRSIEDITDVQKFSAALIAKCVSYWPSIYKVDREKEIVQWHVIVGFNAKNASDLYYSQKIAKQFNKLAIFQKESNSENSDQN
jgi:hypothetical protein